MSSSVRSTSNHAEDDTASSEDSIEFADQSRATSHGRTSEEVCRVSQGHLDERMLLEYADILNEHIANTRLDHTFTCTGGALGASDWTQEQKNRLFRALSRYGSHEGALVAKATGRSIAEVNHYISVLHESSTTVVGMDDIPAAIEVDETINDVLEHLADVTEANLHDQLCAADQSRYLDDWIIDQEHCDESDNHSEAEDQAEGPLASHQLLRADALVEVMRNVFMNGNNDGRWDEALILTEGSDGPSILRSAFEDIYRLVLDFTRRLVQASLLQTTMRLRAETAADGRMVPAVRSIDVTTTLRLLNLKLPHRSDYWRDALSKRFDIQVYSRQEKFRKTRSQGSRIGWQLSKAELIQELSQTTQDHASMSDVEEGVQMDSTDGSDKEVGTSEMDDEDDQEEISSGSDDHEMAVEAHDMAESVRSEQRMRSRLGLPVKNPP